MMGHTKGMNAAPFDGFNFRFDVLLFILPRNFGFGGYRGGGVSPANESPPQLRRKTKETNAFPPPTLPLRFPVCWSAKEHTRLSGWVSTKHYVSKDGESVIIHRKRKYVRPLLCVKCQKDKLGGYMVLKMRSIEGKIWDEKGGHHQ